MKLNDYKRTMGSLNAPHSALNKAIDAVRTAELSDADSADTGRGRRLRLPYTAAIAAVLALALITAAVFAVRSQAPGAQEGPHSFIIKAGAAEVNSDYFVEIGELEEDGTGVSINYTKDGEGHYSYSRVEFTKTFAFDSFRCFGEGVDYFTYTVHGGYLMMDGRTGEVMTVYSGDSPELDRRELTEDGADRFTITDAEYDTFISFTFNDITGKFKERMIKEEVDEQGRTNIIDPGNDDYGDVYGELFLMHEGELWMRIDAHYEDGTTLSKTVVFELRRTKEADRELWSLNAKLEE